MDNYFSWVEPTFFVSSFLLYVFSLYKVSFELVSSREVSEMKGVAKKHVEYFHANKDRISISINEINNILIVFVTVAGYIFIHHILSLFIIEEYFLVALSLLFILFVLFLITNIFPLLTSFLRVIVLKISPMVRIVIYIISPITSIIYKFKTIAFNMENSGSMSSISMDELSDAVEIVSKASTPEDKRILTGMVRFANADVSDIMCHRTDMVAISYTSSYKEVLEVIRESGFSRIPVYHDILDNIIGILYVKDIIPNIEVDNFDWISIIRKPYFVSDTKMINELLVKFQKKKIHLAIVVDEYGSTQGIVSLEDILEEIVGEIEDESDTEDPYYSKIDENTYIFEGKTAISDFIQVLDIPADKIEAIKGDAETLAGLIVEFRQDIPKIGSKAYVLNYCLTIVKIDKHRIERVKVTKQLKNANKE